MIHFKCKDKGIVREIGYESFITFMECVWQCDLFLVVCYRLANITIV